MIRAAREARGVPIGIQSVWEETMREHLNPSGTRLGKRLRKAMELLADIVLNPERRWKTYADQVVAIRDALDELEQAARASKLAIENRMKTFGLRVTKKEIEDIGRRAKSWKGTRRSR